jgi:o-succinylbenzoate---CoA ligase
MIEEVWGRGDALCMIDQRLSPAGKARMLNALQPTIVRDLSGDHKIDHGVPAEEGDALVVLSSGSIAEPKAVVHTTASIAASAWMTTRALRIDPSVHRWLCCLPVVHIGGFSVLARSLVTNTPVDVEPSADPSLLEAAAARGVTHVSLVTTALHRIDPSLFECIVLGGAAPPRNLPANVVTTYGSTETGSGVVYDGVALDGVELEIVDCDDEGYGEIFIKSPTLFRAYRNRPSPFVDGDDGTTGWFPSADVGRFIDGRLEVRGRMADVIVTGGEKVYPTDVEAVIAEIPGVSEVAVWKRPDDEWGERVVAWVVGNDNLALEHVKELVSDAVAPYAAPKELVFVDHLPRTSLGKLQRRSLN